MQEKAKPVFVIATANDIEGLPPELLRKDIDLGRWLNEDYRVPVVEEDGVGAGLRHGARETLQHVEIGLEVLEAQAEGRERGAELVGGIGDERALLLQHGVETHRHGAHGPGQGPQFGRSDRPLVGTGLQVTGGETLDRGRTDTRRSAGHQHRTSLEDPHVHPRSDRGEGTGATSVRPPVRSPPWLASSSPAACPTAGSHR